MEILVSAIDDSTKDLLYKTISDALMSCPENSVLSMEALSRLGEQALLDVLPSHTLRVCQEFAKTSAEALLVNNLPLETEEETPCSGFADERKLHVQNAIQFGFFSILGAQAFAVPYENDGKYIRNVVPNPDAAGTTSSWGADTEFFWHTDNPNWPFMNEGVPTEFAVPRYLGFCGIRNYENVKTEVVSMLDIVDRLPQGIVSELQEAKFSFLAPASNELKASGPSILPVLEVGPEGVLRVRYDRGITSCADESGKDALDTLNMVLGEIQGEAVALNGGDFFIFRNELVLHRRREFIPAPAPQARWLRRCYAA